MFSTIAQACQGLSECYAVHHQHLADLAHSHDKVSASLDEIEVVSEAWKKISARQLRLGVEDFRCGNENERGCIPFPL